MWMPSDMPLRDAHEEASQLDWETIGKAIRECVLDALEMKNMPTSVACEDTVRNDQTGRRVELD